MATHSGFPDWGIGPNANGRLFKIFYTKPDVPNPVAVWPSKPDQIKIAFDKPVDKEYLINLAEKIKIEYGEYVEAADRFEVLRPGYRAVERQLSFLRAPFQVKTADLSEDKRTVIINTITHTSPVNYAITLPAFESDKKNQNSIEQSPTN